MSTPSSIYARTTEWASPRVNRSPQPPWLGLYHIPSVASIGNATLARSRHQRLHGRSLRSQPLSASVRAQGREEGGRTKAAHIKTGNALRVRQLRRHIAPLGWGVEARLGGGSRRGGRHTTMSDTAMSKGRIPLDNAETAGSPITSQPQAQSARNREGRKRLIQLHRPALHVAACGSLRGRPKPATQTKVEAIRLRIMVLALPPPDGG
jgi:hypothetical protein